MTKEQLRAYRDIKLERDKLEGMLEEVKVALYGLRAPRMDGMPRGGSGTTSILEEHIVRHDELLNRYSQKVAELSAALVEIENAIEILEPRERTLIRLYYVQGLTWEAVCVEMNYSWSQIHRIHGAALKALREVD